jgi:hypothetical protein
MPYSPGFNNEIELVKKSVPFLDDYYRRNLITSRIMKPNAIFTNANTVNFKKIDVSGLRNYNRNSGYQNGTVSVTWESFTLPHDRGVRLMLDSMDNEETFGTTYMETERDLAQLRAIPEVDAVTFAEIVGTAGIGLAPPANVVAGTTDIASAIDVGLAKMDNENVPKSGRIIFISENALWALRQNITRTVANRDGIYNDGLERYNDALLVGVPQSRFYSDITLLDTEAGGFEPTTGTAYPINFIIVDPQAVFFIVKRNLSKIITPEANQTADGWVIASRLYYGSKVMDNKLAGVYAQFGATAYTAP